MTTEDWLARHTFHHGDFWDLLAMIREKERQNLTLSLCIPTLNEEATIGKEIVIFKSELMDRYPLLDEIAVIDSGSEDRTCEVARSFGADVYRSADILPAHGTRRGKGENLWKAIHQLKGDVIVYVDADIKNIHPRFVWGLAGPVIYRPDIHYVKAFYDRPLAFSQGVRPSGGGRVTEILVRPLFSLFYPDLAAMIQPLSGEYAVRRHVLERLRFPIGYGVETSHLIDVHRQWGMAALAQTDLDQRVHRNQATRDLGRMAFGILQTFFSRARDHGLLDVHAPLHTVLRQFQVQDRDFEQVLHEIVEEERPPMIEIPEYRAARGLAGGDG